MKKHNKAAANTKRKSRITLLMGLMLLFCVLGVSCACAQTLTLPYAIKAIEEEAFMGDTALTEVIVPEGATSIGARAFAGCVNFERIAIPNSVSSIGEDAFDLCENLTIVCAHNTTAEAHALANNIGIEYTDSIGVPDGLEYEVYEVNLYGYYTYAVITGYTGSASELVIPADVEGVPVKYIGVSAFEDCTSLKSIHIPESVKYIDAFAFEGCTNLVSIDIPDSVTSIGRYAFQGCSSLTSIDIPEGVTEIELNTFAHCSSLESIDIPDSVTSIGCYAFQGCSSLTSIDIPEGVTEIEEYVFCDCSSLTSIDIPEGLIEIGLNAFAHCSSLESIDIPDSVTSIGRYAFQGCSSLTSIDIPEGVTEIELNTFAHCSSLESIDIPDSVTSIGCYAFQGCSSLTSIDIPEGVTEIRSYTFAYCSNLTSVGIPNSVTIIGEGTFYDCSSLESIDIPESVTSIGDMMFAECSSLTSIDIPDGITSITDYMFFYCSSLTNIDIPDSVTSIGRYAFRGCSSLTSIDIPEGVTEIETCAFCECSSLTSIYIPEGVTEIRSDTFAYCSNLTSVYIPASVDYIGNGAFNPVADGFTIYGEPGSYAETYAKENGIAFSAVESSPMLSIFDIYSPRKNDSLTTPNVKIRWQDQYAADKYRLSLYEISDDETDKVIIDQYETSDTRFECTLEYGKTYRVSITAVNTVNKVTCSRVFSIVDRVASANIVRFAIQNSPIKTGDVAVFEVESTNAQYIQLIVDGEYYDSLPVTSSPMTMGRMFTLAGERQVSFRAYGNGVWSEPCKEQTLSVTANGELAVPQVTCERKIWLGDTLTLSWDAVEHADGYIIYINYPDGTSQKDGIKLNADTLSYTYAADEFAVTGEYSIRLMAYGAGYSQSSSLVPFTVTNEYVIWQGWPQNSKVNTYETADSTIANGYVDYLDPVMVLGEEGDCYLIEMTLTSGATAQRYVRKYDIGTEPFIPGLTLSVDYARGKNGELYLYARTNLVGSKAGVLLAGESLGTLHVATAVRMYTNIYAFEVEPVIGTTEYLLWAEDEEGNRLEENLVITIGEIVPEVTVTPAPEVTVTPTPQVTVTPTPEATTVPEEEIIIPDQEEKEVETGCKYNTDSGHRLEYVQLQNMQLILGNDGRIRVDSATCPGCGGQIRDFGYVPDNVQTQFYFHPVAHYYDTSGNGQAYCRNHDYRRIIVNEDLTITEDIDLNGAPLTVSGVLRIEGTLSGVKEIDCYQLIVENGGELYAENAEYIRASSKTYLNTVTSGGKIEIKEGGVLNVRENAVIRCDGDFIINGTLNGGNTVYCDSLSVGNDGKMFLTDGFTATMLGNFTFKSVYSHSDCFGPSSTLNIKEDIRINSDQFLFDGNCYLTGYRQSIKMNKDKNNYFQKLDMTAGGSVLKLDKDEDKDEDGGKLERNNWDFGNFFIAKNVEGELIDGPAEALVKEFFDRILVEPIKSGSGYAALEGSVDFIKPLLTQTLEPDRNAYMKLLFGDNEGEGSIDPEEVVKGEIGIDGFHHNTDMDALRKIIRYGLMEELFFKEGTHRFDFKAFSLVFSKLEGDSYSYNYNGMWYTLEIEGISMKISTQGVAREIYFIEGKLIESNNRQTKFSYTTDNASLQDAANLLLAAGNAEVVSELSSILDGIEEAAYEALDILKLFDGSYKEMLKDFVYEKCPFQFQEAMDWVDWINKETDDIQKLFKEFKDFYDLSLDFYPVQPEE